MNYAGRIECLRMEMQSQGLVGVFVPLDASLEYFTGLFRARVNNTRTRQNSAEYACLLVMEKQVVYFNPRILMPPRVMAKIGQNPVINEIVPFPDADLTGETLAAACTRFGLKGKKLGFLQDISSSLIVRIQQELSVNWVNFDRVVQMMRLRKDQEELALMRKAAAINDKIYDAVFPMLQPGVTVNEIISEIDRLMVVFGATYNSFNTIVMNFGPAEGVSYGDRYPVLQRGYALSYDYGVYYKGYCSDFGRTIFFGEPKSDLIKAHGLVVQAQKETVAAMKAGHITGEELDNLAHKIISDGGYGEAFTHFVGHSIGKDVHERPFLAEGEKFVLEEGMCFTVEPSICLPNKGYVRMEDVVMATPSGGESFNTTTRDLVVIE